MEDIRLVVVTLLDVVTDLARGCNRGELVELCEVCRDSLMNPEEIEKKEG